MYMDMDICVIIILTKSGYPKSQLQAEPNRLMDLWIMEEQVKIDYKSNWSFDL